MKKKISLATILCIVISALIAILALFNILTLEGTILDLLFTFLTLTVAGILTLNSCEMLERKNKMAIISFSLITLSTFLVILCYWTSFDNSTIFMNTTVVISVLSICFNIISSNILKMRNSYQLIQIISYISYSIVALYIIGAFLKIIKLSGPNLKIFILFIILSFLAMCILAVLSKKRVTENIPNTEYVKIARSEYEELLEKKARLEELLNNKND